MNFYNKVKKIAQKDPRYKIDAYEFVMQALVFTQHKLKKHGHISGGELLEGIRDFGLEQYGPMLKVVLGHWGVKSTEDFGEIVFNMVENNLMGKNENDSREDFKNVYDFDKAFEIKNRIADNQ